MLINVVLPHWQTAGKGDQEPGRPADDLVFVVSEKPHDRFTRSGNDLVRCVGLYSLQSGCWL